MGDNYLVNGIYQDLVENYLDNDDANYVTSASPSDDHAANASANNDNNYDYVVP